MQLDSVICAQCGTTSRSAQDTCPRCNADREGAIFTAGALRLVGEVPRAGWLVTTVRRNAITSYPSIREQGEPAPEPERRRTLTGVLTTGGIVVGLAIGAYLHANSGNPNKAPGAVAALSSGGSIAVESRAPTASIPQGSPPIVSTSSVAAAPPAHATTDRNAAPSPHAAANLASNPPTNSPQAAKPTPSATRATTVASREISVAAPQVAKPPPPTRAATVASREISVAAPQVAKPPPPTRATTVASRETQVAAPQPAKLPPPPTRVAANDAPRGISVARSVSVTRTALAHHDLTSARRHMRDLSEDEQRSPELQRLADQLARLEHQRDAALQRARTCAATKASTCVVRNANQALALDARNPQATTLLRRASAFPKPAPVRANIVAADTETDTAANRHTYPFESSVGIDHSQTEQPSFTWFGWGVPTVSKGRGEAH
ncbi:hypothetical protein [Caballeronia choica]|nr:hypothetical protein [Caballeronia choica]